MIIREKTRENLSSARAVADTVRSILERESEVERDKEHFWVIGLDTKNRVKFIDLVSLGTLTHSIIHPREAYRLAVMKGVCSIVCAHNHPSGDPEPSRDDIAVTQRLKEAGDILGIRLLDHVIVGDDNRYVSLQERGVS